MSPMSPTSPTSPTSPSFRRSRICMALALVTLTACESSGRLTAPTPIGALSLSTTPRAVANATFDPQPDPPARYYPFAMPSFLAQTAGRGAFTVCGAQGTVDVRTVSSVRAGQVVQLTQTWSFAASPCRGAVRGECVPASSATLTGSMNVLTGALVLDGVSDHGVRVHVTARAGGPTGPTGIAGEVMFNPQPDPPACRAIG